MSTENKPPASLGAAPYRFTLKDLDESMWSEHPLGRTAFGMQVSGFHRWGFVIYRTTYNDDAMWERYLQVLKLSAQDCLVSLGGDVLLEQYMDWLVISDPSMLDGASKVNVKKHFQSWCAARSEERDGPGADKSWTKRLPRFQHCVYVDRKCLDTVTQLPANYMSSRGRRPNSNMVAVVIDGTFDETTSSNDQGLYPNVEGCTGRYVGWRYDGIEMLVDTYEEAHDYSLSGTEYKRPPLISPFGFKSMPA